MAPPALAERTGAARLWVGSGYDSNASRTPEGPLMPVGTAPEPDGVVSILGSTEGLLQTEAAQASGIYDLGLRKFFRLPSEDVVIQSAALEGSVALGRVFALGATARGKDRRGGSRDYTDLFGGAFLEGVAGSTTVRLHGGGHRFLYRQFFPSSFAASEAGVGVRHRFDRRHQLLAFGDVAFRRYNAQRDGDPSLPPAEQPPPAQRTDLVLSGGAGYSYRGPLTLALTYQYFEQASNSFAKSTMRHRLTLTSGLRLPARITLLGQLALQLARESLEALDLQEDEESHNSASLKLVRALSAHVDGELRWALYQDQFPTSGHRYLRHHGWVGLTWRL